MDKKTIEHLVSGYKVDWERADPEVRVEGVEVVGVARVLGDRVTAVSLKPHAAGSNAFDQSPPRHGYLGQFTATVSSAARPGNYVRVNDITVTNVESGAQVDE